jgi:hypothetical protein
MDLPVNYENSSPKQRRLVREEYVSVQGGLCQFCGNPLDGDPSDEVKNAWIYKKLFPKFFFKHPVHLHHDHDTGMTIGAVHARCNAHLWQYHGE